MPLGGDTLAEGIAVKQPGELTSRILKDNADDVVLVPERDLERAVAMLVGIEKTVVEGAGAAGLAAVLAHPERFAGKKLGLVLCGGNIDPRLLANVQRAMDAAEQGERERSAGQGGLFGDLAPAAFADGAPARDWLVCAPWTEERRLHEEKSALGFYLSGHLFTAYEGELRRFVKTRLSDLPRLAESGHGATPVTVA